MVWKILGGCYGEDGVGRLVSVLVNEAVVDGGALLISVRFSGNWVRDEKNKTDIRESFGDF